MTNSPPDRSGVPALISVAAAAAVAVTLGIGCQAAQPTQPGNGQVTLVWSSTADGTAGGTPAPAPGQSQPSASPGPSTSPQESPPPFIDRQVSTLVGDGTDRVLLDPAGLAVGADGTLFVADQGVPAVLRIGSDGKVVRLAGGVLGRKDGSGADAQFWSAGDLALLPDGSLAVVDGDRLRRVSSAGDVSTMQPVSASGNAWSWLQVFGVAADAAGNLYVSTLHRVDRITPDGKASVLAGANDPGYADGTGGSAAFDLPRRMDVAPDGTVVVADSGNNRIRAISPSGRVTTLAGDGTAGMRDGEAGSAQFDSPEGVWVGPQGEILVADSGNSAIREIRAGQVRTVAGDGSAGFRDGTGSQAQFAWPVAISDGLVADGDNRRIRKLQ